MVDELIAKGHSEDEAFSEVYSIECNMDEDDDIDEAKRHGISYEELCEYKRSVSR